MPETTNERLRCGRDGSGRHPQNQAEKTPEEPRSSTLLQPRELVLPPTSGGQSYNDVSCRIHPAPALPSHIQYRPSVLRQGTQSSSSPASRCRLENGSSQLVPMCKVEVQVDAAQHGQSSPMHAGSSPRLTGHSLPPRRGSPKQNSMESRVHDDSSRPPGSQTASALFVSGLCRWPGCDAALEDFSSFLKHLHSKHSHDEKSVAQWRVQQDMVHYMERQLTLERQKLFAMQLHLHISERNLSDLAVSDWPYSMAAFLSQPPETDGNGAVDCAALGDLGDLAHHSYWPTATVHFLPDLVPSIECYKYRNIRPPYTYAHLIRWAILESPDKQRTLNEIYTWFTSMFFYFRHNTATWKNAVRHNLSLHKCFVRVEGAKGAVWIVDEAEFQRRKAQKYYRDHPAKWMTPYTQFCPEQP